jgi:hypothetical protein
VTEQNAPIDPRPAALVAAALGCLDSAIRIWISTNGSEAIGELLDNAMSAIRPL